VAGTLAACGNSNSSGSAAASATTSLARTAAATSADAPPRLVAVLHAAGHHPHVGNFPITLTLTRAGHPVAGHVSYEFLFGGQVVSRQPVGMESPNFVGTFHDTLIWPANSVGYPITVRVLITTPYGPTHVDYTVQVQR
jgi:hypothetical protein